MVTGRLLSVNVGVPREVQWEGKIVRTAIWKEPVDGPRMVRRINIDGDDQADRLAHGGEHRAVFVYQVDSYRYWEQELGRDDFTHGQFGENFTVEGLADDEVCVGDLYRIGGALFEVTQPRVTCYRVGIRMDDPAMPTLLVAHHRPGFYFRVLEEGEVQAGDEIVRVAEGPERLTIAQVDALLYLPGKSRELLERALRVPALSEGWRGSFRELLAKAGHEAAPPAWSGFRPLRVAEIRQESTTIASFLLVPTDDLASAPTAAPGQYLTVRVRPQADAPPLVRSYSLSAIPDERGYRISVKREGAGSRYLHDNLKVGDSLDVAAPRGSFVLREGARPVVLISAGVGATPVLAMLHALVRDHTERPVWWLHGARNRAEHAFAAEVDELLAALPGAHCVVAYSRPRRARTDLHRGLRRRRRLCLGHRQGRRPRAPRARRPAWRGAGRHVLPQQPRGALGRPLPEPARLRRGVRRAGQFRLSQRDLPQLRERPACRRGQLPHRAARTAARWSRSRVLHAAGLGAHAGPLTAG